MIAQHTVNTGSAADDGTGDTVRDAFDKTNTDVAALIDHANAAGNPHGTSAHEVGAYTQAEIDAKLAALGGIAAMLVAIGEMAELARQAAASRSGAAEQYAAVAAAAAQAAALVATAQDTAAAVLSKFIVSTDPPSGGRDGDIWFKI